VRRFARAATVDELLAKARDGKPSILDEHKAYLHQRWNDGCTNVLTLFQEIKARGYHGSYGTVREYPRLFRGTTAPAPRPTAPKVRDVTRWLLSRPDSLEDEEKTNLAQVLSRCPHLQATAEHVATFADMLTSRRGRLCDMRARGREEGSARRPPPLAGVGLLTRSSREPVVQRHPGRQRRQVAGVTDRRRGVGECLDRHPGETAADADPLRPHTHDVGDAQARQCQDVDRTAHRRAHRAYLAHVAQPGCVEHVRARLLEGLQPLDRVGEVGVVTDVVLGARRESERKAQSTRGLDRSDDSLGRMRGLIETTRRVEVLDGASDRAGAGCPRDGPCHPPGISAVPVLEVDRHREVRRAVEDGGVLDHLVERHRAVQSTECVGESGAGRGDRAESERLEDTGRSGVPGKGMTNGSAVCSARNAAPFAS
jgi:hypothetical protein